jgi:hypothetical protein
MLTNDIHHISECLNATYGQSLGIIIKHLKSEMDYWQGRMNDISPSVDCRPNLAAEETDAYCAGRFCQCRATLNVMGVY